MENATAVNTDWVNTDSRDWQMEPEGALAQGVEVTLWHAPGNSDWHSDFTRRYFEEPMGFQFHGSVLEIPYLNLQLRKASSKVPLI